VVSSLFIVQTQICLLQAYTLPPKRKLASWKHPVGLLAAGCGDFLPATIHF